MGPDGFGKYQVFGLHGHRSCKLGHVVGVGKSRDLVPYS